MASSTCAGTEREFLNARGLDGRRKTIGVSKTIGVGSVFNDNQNRHELTSRQTELTPIIFAYVDPDRPLQGIHRDAENRSYLEFATDDPEKVKAVLHEHGHDPYVRLEETNDPLGEPCQNCGNVAGRLSPPECPNCGFQDISPCPICGQLNSRQDYETVSGKLFVCPHPVNGARHRVRLIFNEPMFRPDGRFNEPLVLVREATRR